MWELKTLGITDTEFDTSDYTENATHMPQF